MTKAEIVKALREKHDAFVSYINSLSDHDFEHAEPGKWSGGQQLDHIYRAVKPVKLAFTLPAFVVKWKFGVTNRPSRTYDELVQRYHDKLAQGGVATGPFVPPVIPASAKDVLVRKMNRLTTKLCKVVDSYADDKLDVLILPHPLIGKITLREMLYFTIYHVEHHHAIVKERLSQ